MVNTPRLRPRRTLARVVDGENEGTHPPAASSAALIAAPTASSAYDEQRLRGDVARWPKARRVAFAAAVAERLRPAYELFTTVAEQGDAAGLRAARDTAWRAAAGAP